MATVSQQIITANKRFTDAEKRAKADMAMLRKVYEKVIGLKSLPQSLESAKQDLDTSRKELKRLLEEGNKLFDDAVKCAKEYDMAERKASESAKYLEELIQNQKEMAVKLKAKPRRQEAQAGGRTARKGAGQGPKRR